MIRMSYRESWPAAAAQKRREVSVEEACAFAPGNISCVFKIVHHEDPRKMHSLGMGFTIEDGVRVAVRLAGRTTVLFNGGEIQFPTVASAVRKLTPRPIRVDIESGLPLGCGFGLSGASALAAAYSVNALLDLGRPDEDLAMTAHVAEVENLTGLGDVCGQYHGGWLVKLHEGQPLAAQRLPVGEPPVYFRFYGPIATREVLGSAEQKERINRAADDALREIGRLIESGAADFDACIGLSKAFAVESGLLRDERVLRAIRQVEADGGVASMIMLGNAVFSTRAFEGARKTTLSHQKARGL